MFIVSDGTEMILSLMDDHVDRSDDRQGSDLRSERSEMIRHWWDGAVMTPTGTSGMRLESWEYPNRESCLRTHNRAARCPCMYSHMETCVVNILRSG